MTPDTNQGAFELNGLPVNRERFYQVACDPRRSVVVEACAGAGKTWMLVSRILRALMDGAQPQDILAITFTKKAAAEMRLRLSQWLLEFSSADAATLQDALRQRGLVDAATDPQLESLRNLHHQLLRMGRPVQVRTFHSWFAALLRSAPVAVLEALQLPIRYELLEDDAQAMALVWRPFYARVRADADLRADFFATVAEHGRHQTQKALEAALAKRAEFALADAQGVVDASVQTMAERYPALASHASPHAYLFDPAQQDILWRAARALGVCTSKNCVKAAAALEAGVTHHDADAVFQALFTQGGSPRKLVDKQLDAHALQGALDLLGQVQAACAQQEAWQHQHRMARLVRVLLAQFSELKRERGWVDMGDLERTAQVLLSDPQLSGWMQERLDSRVRHLLIDEFQDTNPLQWQTLLAWLSGYSGASNAPSVFIVGDPKQSIYRFRRAEPQVFEAAKVFVTEGLRGDLLSCDHTRRNAPAIVEVVNAVMLQARQVGAYQGFRPHTTESEVPGQVWCLPRIERKAPVEPAHPTGDAEPNPPALLWRDSLTTPRYTEEETRKTLEVRQAAHWVASQLRNGSYGLRPRDIMVLCRRRERLGLLQGELATLGIAAQQPEKSDLGEQPEVQDIVGLLDALVSTRHDLSLARALKSPIFGLQDSDLVRLAQEVRRRVDVGGQPTGWWQVLQTCQDFPDSMRQAAQTLRRWSQWVSDLPPHDAIARVYEDGDVLARYAAVAPAPLRAGMLANIRAVLHVALQHQGGRYVTPYALVRALRAGGNPVPVQADVEAVRLLTIHGAKGLEAPLVLLLDTDAESSRGESMGVLVQWPAEAAHPQKLVFLASESKPPPCALAALEQEQEARAREELNALYVALTRAQTTLAFSAVQPHRTQAQSWWHRLQGHAVPAEPISPAAPFDGLEGQSPRPVTLRVVPPVNAMPDTPMRVARGSVTGKPDAESMESRIGQAMHRLLEWYTQARPWSALQLQHVRQAFALDDQQLELAHAMALGIVQGEGAWAWDPSVLAFAGNEVAMTRHGRTLRVDRLVQRRDSGTWWVLDFKSSEQPLHQSALRAQLAQYHAAVSALCAPQPVRAAFLTPQGRMLELDLP